MSGQATIKELRKKVRALQVSNNALRIVVQGVKDYYRCDDEGELPEDAHGGDWESCWHCQATRALESPEDFATQPPHRYGKPATHPVQPSDAVRAADGDAHPGAEAFK